MEIFAENRPQKNINRERLESIRSELHANAHVIFEKLTTKVTEIGEILLDEPFEIEDEYDMDEVTAVVKAYVKSVDEYLDAVETYVDEVEDAYRDLRNLCEELDDIVSYAPGLDYDKPDAGDVVNLLDIPF